MRSIFYQASGHDFASLGNEPAHKLKPAWIEIRGTWQHGSGHMKLHQIFKIRRRGLQMALTLISIERATIHSIGVSQCYSSKPCNQLPQSRIVVLHYLSSLHRLRSGLHEASNCNALFQWLRLPEPLLADWPAIRQSLRNKSSTIDDGLDFLPTVLEASQPVRVPICVVLLVPYCPHALNELPI